MENRRLDMEIPLNRDQWEMLGRRAQALGPADAGFQWQEREPEQIHVYLRDEDATGVWRNYVSPDGRYGRSERELARFHFNDGRPYADVLAPAAADEPAITDAQEQAMQLDLERWIRAKWHELMRESGLHYVKGHTDADVR